MANKNLTYYGQVSFIANLLFLFTILISCGNNEVEIAQVGKTILYESDALVLMKHAGINSEDKKEYNEFVEEWCNKQLYIEELKLNHPDEWKLIKLRSNKYSGDLAKFKLEDIKIRATLDTMVKDGEVLEYYKEHKEQFILQDYLIKGLYLKIPKGVDYKSKKINSHY